MQSGSNQSVDIAKELLAAFDESISSNIWQESVLLRAILTKLKELREKLGSELTIYDEKHGSTFNLEQSGDTFNEDSNLQPVYIHLYNLDGDNLRKWEKLLMNIDKQVSTRAVYSHQQDILEVMRSNKSQNKKNEAYIVAQLNKQDILQNNNGPTSCDKLGHALVTIKDRAINIDKIKYFYHVSGDYYLLNGKLIPLKKSVHK